jgi:hypothetical protein
MFFNFHPYFIHKTHYVCKVFFAIIKQFSEKTLFLALLKDCENVVALLHNNNQAACSTLKIFRSVILYKEINIFVYYSSFFFISQISHDFQYTYSSNSIMYLVNVLMFKLYEKKNYNNL